MKNQGIAFSEGTTWTTDAPYRETKKEIMHYAKHGISTVTAEAGTFGIL